MKNLLFLACFLFAFSVNGQNKQISASDLIGCWTDSKEEGTKDLSIYRPCSTENTIDLYRFSFQLRENGTCSYYSISARSSNKKAEGTWTFNAEKSKLQLLNSEGRQVTQFTIQEYASDVLKFIKEM